MDADPILPNLYMGAHDLPLEPAVAGVKEFYARVLCAAELQSCSGRLARNIVHMPLLDDLDPLTRHEVEAVREIAESVALYVARGDRVLVTCAQGRNRSGLVVARALMYLGFEPRKAINAVRARRRWVNERPQALTNETFCAWLRSGG